MLSRLLCVVSLGGPVCSRGAAGSVEAHTKGLGSMTIHSRADDGDVTLCRDVEARRPHEQLVVPHRLESRVQPDRRLRGRVRTALRILLETRHHDALDLLRNALDELA